LAVVMVIKSCTFKQCEGKVHARSLCIAHYRRLQRYGNPALGRLPVGITAEERFLRSVDKTGECWLWTGARNSSGYAQMHLEGRKQLMHRWSYSYYVTPIPAGMEIDHLCRNRICVRPGHLEAVTTAENQRRAVPFRTPVTQCPSGHSYTEENTYVNRHGSPVCRKCRNVYSANLRRIRRGGGVRLAAALIISGGPS
jgi:transposase-like protein